MMEWCTAEVKLQLVPSDSFAPTHSVLATNEVRGNVSLSAAVTWAPRKGWWFKGREGCYHREVVGGGSCSIGVLNEDIIPALDWHLCMCRGGSYKTQWAAVHSQNTGGPVPLAQQNRSLFCQSLAKTLHVHCPRRPGTWAKCLIRGKKEKTSRTKRDSRVKALASTVALSGLNHESWSPFSLILKWVLQEKNINLPVSDEQEQFHMNHLVQAH